MWAELGQAFSAGALNDLQHLNLEGKRDRLNRIVGFFI
jgi:hypothetical protein